MTTGVAGREITRILLDNAVTIQLWQMGRPTAEIKLEEDFELIQPAVGRVLVDPEALGDRAVVVAALFGAVVRDIAVAETGVLTVTFADSRVVRASPHAQYESWSYVSDDGGRVICGPGGGLAIWDPLT